MAAVLIFLIPFLAFLLRARVLGEYGGTGPRRGLTGAETARQLLDSNAASQIVIEPASGLDRLKASRLKQLRLEVPVHDGRSLYAAAEAARQTALLVRLEGAIFSFDLSRRLRALLGYTIPVAWVLLLWGGAPRAVAAGFFAVLFLFSLMEMPRQWEASREAFGLIKQSGLFEVDEQVQLRKLLRALRLDTLAFMYQAPADRIAELFRRMREPHGV